MIKEWVLDAPLYEPRDYPRDSVRLDLNENPEPPPQTVIQAAITELMRANRYPEKKLYDEFLDALEHYVGIGREYLVFGPGSDAILRALFEASLNPGDAIVYPSPSFSMYEVYAKLYRAKASTVPLRDCGDKWCLSLSELIEKARYAKLVLVDNPNNPTGSILLDTGQVEELVSSTEAIVVVDEAYFEYSGVTVKDLVESYENLVVVRTFSKAFGLAGLRIGYAIASPRVRAALWRFLAPFPVSRPSIAAARAALQNRSYVKHVVETVRKRREELAAELRRLGMKPYRSWTNFLLVNTYIDDVVGKLARKGIAVRKVPMGSTWMRVSIGSAVELSKLL